MVRDTPSHVSDHLCLTWKESIHNCRWYRADTACGTDGRTDGRTDGQTEWNQYTPQQLRCIMSLIMWIQWNLLQNWPESDFWPNYAPLRGQIGPKHIAPGEPKFYTLPTVVLVNLKKQVSFESSGNLLRNRQKTGFLPNFWHYSGPKRARKFGPHGPVFTHTHTQTHTGTARYSEWSLVRRFIGPKIVHWSEWSIVRQVGSPKGHWSENHSIGPNGQ